MCTALNSNVALAQLCMKPKNISIKFTMRKKNEGKTFDLCRWVDFLCRSYGQDTKKKPLNTTEELDTNKFTNVQRICVDPLVNLVEPINLLIF